MLSHRDPPLEGIRLGVIEVLPLPEPYGLERLVGEEAGPGVEDDAEHGGAEPAVERHRALVADDALEHVEEVAVLAGLGNGHDGPRPVQRVRQGLARHPRERSR